MVSGLDVHDIGLRNGTRKGVVILEFSAMHGSTALVSMKSDSRLGKRYLIAIRQLFFRFVISANDQSYYSCRCKSWRLWITMAQSIPPNSGFNCRLQKKPRHLTRTLISMHFIMGSTPRVRTQYSVPTRDELGHRLERFSNHCDQTSRRAQVLTQMDFKSSICVPQLCS